MVASERDRTDAVLRVKALNRKTCSSVKGNLSWFQVKASSFLCKIIACSYRFAGINFISCVASTKTTDQKKNPQIQTNTLHQLHTAARLDSALFWKLQGVENQAHPQGNSNEIDVQPWELICPKPHFLLLTAGIKVIFWILQRLLHILMSNTFYQTLTIIFRARKLLHSVRGSQEIR